jgi:plasmid rolling circle replication initiator protein Rep
MTKQSIIVNGNGSDLGNSKGFKGRAKRKMITQKTILNLVDVMDKYGADERKKSYWNTYHCLNKVYTANGKLYGKYCKNRFCTLCCSIRKAQIINSYLPVIQTWEEPYFVTLTIKAIKAERLKILISKILEGFQIIKDRYRKRNSRGTDIKLIGIKSLECNFNPAMKTYNPHLHLIVANKRNADILKREWLMLWKDNWAYKGAQKISKVGSTEKALIEIVKYGSKIFTEPDVRKKTETKDQSKIYVAALDNIFTAMKGVRIFERFGFDLPKDAQPNQSKATVIKEYYEWVYDANYFDWLNTENELTLSGYDPEAKLLDLLENRIDTLLR